MKKILLLSTFLMLISIFSINAQKWIETDKTLPIPHPLPTENYYYGHSTSIDGDYAVIGAYNANSATGVAYVLYYDGTSWEHVAKLTGSDCDASDYFGYSVSISGDNIVVGAWQNYAGASNSGAAYVFTKPAGGWEDATETVKLVSDDIAGNDYFGRSVSIDGNTIVVGATSDGDNGSYSGSAYVFTYDGSNWSQAKKLLASDGAASDYFGKSVSISGNYIAVGADGDDDIDSQTGSIYVFTNPGTGWANASQSAKLTTSDAAANDYLGRSICISGDNIIAGTSNQYWQRGAAYLFTKPASGWTDATETEKFLASDASTSSYFGSSVSISGDYIIIGSYNAKNSGTTRTGAAYVFENNSGTWSESAKLLASTGVASDYFGYSASISGDNIVIGAYQDDDNGNYSGASFLFAKPASGWTDMTETATSIPYGEYSNEDDNYGNSIAIDGDYAVVGASHENSERGGAYVLYYNGTEWVTQAKLTASDGATNDEFGCSVAIDGDNIVIGAYEDGNYIGAAYVFTKPTSGWADATEDVKLSQNLTSSYYGSNVAILDDNIFVSAYGYQTNKGCVYVYSNNSGTWTLSSTLTASDGAASDYFGSALDVSGDNLVVGAYGESSNIGAAYVFTNNTGTWSQSAKLTASDGAVDDRLNRVAIDGNNIAVGASGDESGTGAVYIFEKPESGWSDATETLKLTASDGATTDYFGNSVDIEGNNLIIGAYYNNDGAASYSGSAYLFTYNGTTWVETEKYSDSEGASNDYFGAKVCISDDNIAIGSKGDDDNYDNSGSAHFYKYRIKEQPVSQLDVCPTSSISFDVETNFTETFQWQVSTDNGSSFINISDNAIYSNSSTNSLEVIVDASLYNNLYQCELSSAYGILTTDTARLTVITDNEDPVLVVQNITVYVDESGNTSITASDVVTSATDNCFIADTTLSQSAFDCSDIGTPVTVNVTLSDISGNETIEQSTITVADNINPDFDVNDYTLELDESGKATLVGAMVASNALDNCSNSHYAVSKDKFDCSNIETPVVVDVTLYDANGNTTTKQATITVEDNVDPTLSVQNFTLELDETGNATLLASDVVTSASNNCSLADTTLSQTAFNSSHIGTPVTIDVTLSDESGNDVTEQATITIVDNVDPILTVQDYTLQLDELGEATLKLADVVVSASDNCSIADTVLSKTAFDCSNIGTPVTVDVTLSDESGNETTKQVSITVEDNIDPDFDVNDYTLELDENGEANLVGAMVASNALDNCSNSHYAVSKDKFDCSNIGTPVTIDVSLYDVNGNATTKQATITVEDNVDPILVTKNRTLSLNYYGEATLKPSDVVNSASDNCSIADTTLSQTDFDCSNIGTPVTVDVTLLDESGNQVTEQAIITVADNIVPALSVQDYTLELDETGNANLKASNVVTYTYDDCTMADTILSQSSFNCSDIEAPVIIDVTVTDGVGHAHTENATITVVDNIAPVLSVQNHTLQLDETGNATLLASDVVTGSNDNCTIADTTLSQTAFDCSNIGTPVTVDVTLIDESGNETTEQAIITVEDNINPELSVQDFTLELDETGNAVLLTSDVVTGADDNCTIADTTLSQTNFDCSYVGIPVTIDVILIDKSGNETTDQATINVEDNIAPALSVQSVTLQLDESGSATLKASDVVISATDNCSLADTILSITDFDCSYIGGSHGVYVRVYDNSGNYTEKLTNVVVEDNIDPVITSTHNDITINDEGNCEASLPDYTSTVVATDNCDASLTISQSPVAGTTISGLVPVTLTVTDNSDNEANVTFNVFVDDNTNPELSVQDIVLQLNANGEAILQASDVVTGAIDNCAIADTTLSQTTFNCSNIGTPVTVDVTLSDAVGNEVTEQVSITVEDNIDPVLSVQNYTIYVDNNGSATLSANDVVTDASDNCSIADTTLNQTNFDCSNIGTPVTVEVTLSDAVGNEVTEQVSITVEDNIDPVLSVQNHTIYVDNNGSATLSVKDVVTDASDNCSIADTTLSQTNFDCSNIGAPVTVNVTLIDESGNETTEQVSITIEDTIDPEIPTLSDIVEECSATVATPTTIDNCAGTITATTSDALTYNTQGTYTINWNFDDGNGNSIEVIQNVIIEDNTNPTITCHADTSIVISQGESNYSVEGSELDPVSTNDNCSVVSLANDFNNESSLSDATLPIGTTTIVWTVTDEAGNTITCSYDVSISVASGIDDIESDYIRIYPNPANSYIQIESKTAQIKRIAIYDITGKLVIQDTDKAHEYKIDINHLNEGIYLVKIITNDFDKVIKFVKK